MRKLFVIAAAGMLGACASAGAAPETGAPDPVAQADSVRNSWTEADVRFMTDMIHHHAQALVMSRMVPERAEGGDIRTLAARITNGQRDEIASMQAWLRDRNQPVPEPDSTGMVHGGGHDEHHDHAGMPGMLSAAQLAELEAARGAAFDELFLRYMIQHHSGALTMVNELFSSQGAAQEDAIFKLAAEIGAEQETEIARMQRMLADRLFATDGSE